MKKYLLLFSLALILRSASGIQPQISFCCELSGREFSALLSDTSLIRKLAEMHVSLRVGLHDFSPERTLALQKLNRAGIPIYAWLLLPEDDGYWFNMQNGGKALKRYEAFKEWTRSNNLQWEGIGIDLEPDINDAKLALNHPWHLAWKIYKRLYDNRSLSKGKEMYQTLVGRMKADGYTVESYLIPLIFEERAGKTSSLQKLMGIVDIETDSEIPMLYTSAMDNPGIIPFYHRDKMPVALGSTGGGVNIEGITMAAITWEKLERDLLIASKLTDHILVFCLESSVQRGFLDKIQNLDWSRQAIDITTEKSKYAKISQIIRAALFVLDYPLILTIVLLSLTGVLIVFLYKLVRLIIRMIISGR